MVVIPNTNLVGKKRKIQTLLTFNLTQQTVAKMPKLQSKISPHTLTASAEGAGIKSLWIHNSKSDRQRCRRQ